MVWSRIKLSIATFVLLFPILGNSAISFTEIAEKIRLKTGTPLLRVRVAKALHAIQVSGTDLARTLHLTKNSKNYAGKKTIKFECANVARRNSTSPLLLASLGSPTGLLSVDKDGEHGKYLGKILISTSTDQKRCDVINEIDMESYLSTLLAKEMNSKWPVEALKAQAVAARTYALHKIYSKEVSKVFGSEVPFDLESSEKHQVSGKFSDETPKTRLAAVSTAGEVLVNDEGELAPVFFHAKCGGRTRLPEQVWQNPVKGYESVNCPFCKDHGRPGWQSEISTERLEKFVRWASEKGYFHPKRVVQAGELIKVADDRWSANRLRISYGNITALMEKSVLRRYFGRVELRSNNFHVRLATTGDLVLEGNGHGHGVGLCQMGALEMAQRGYDHKKILSHYFPNMKLVKVYQ